MNPITAADAVALVRDGIEVVIDLVDRYRKLGMSADAARVHLRALHALGLRVEADLLGLANGSQPGDGE